MIDLPAPSTASTSATAARPVANSSAHGAPARDPGAQEGDNHFQAVLAHELRLASDSRTLPGQRLPSAAVKAGSSLKPGQDAAQTAAAGDAPVAPVGAAIIPFPPALAGTAKTGAVLRPGDDAAQTAVANDALLSPASAAMLPFPPAPSGTSISPPGTSATAMLPPAFPSTGIGPAGQASDARKHSPARTATASEAEPELHIDSTAADLAAPGKFALPTDGAIRREDALDTSLIEQHRSAPAQSLAMHAGGGVPAPAQVAQGPGTALEARVGERGWDQGLGDKLVWMAGQRQQVAELHLNPPDLGPLKITLTLDHDQASAQFVSAHATVREAIETAMPRLREMLADSGITLGNASVSTDAFREQTQPRHEPRADPAPLFAAAADPGAVTRGERLLRRPHGLVDTYA